MHKKKNVYCVEGADGDAWIMVGQRVIMYVTLNGAIITPNDIVAFADVPKPP